MRETDRAARGRYLTEDLPGTGGRIRSEPEDFRVEEIPLSPPEGAGEHLYLWVEKRGLPTLEVVRAVGRALGAAERDAGFAGMKDARAVARQWLSFRCPGGLAERRLVRVERALGDGVRILRAARGRSKLRRGALRGNRFEVRLRGTGPEGPAKARAVLCVLEERGVPNAFGDQRFGAGGRSAEVGRALVLGDWARALSLLLGEARLAGGGLDARLREACRRFEAGDFEGALRLYPPGWEAERRVLSRLAAGARPERALRAIPGREEALFGSALQAALFNACLARRVARDAHDRLLEGDVAVSHRTGKARRIGDPAKEADALARFEVSPSGPLLGERMLEARAEPGRMEAAVFDSFGIAHGPGTEGLAQMGLRGGRRPYRARLGALEVMGEGEDLLLRFLLPPGAYASEVLREVAKVDPPLGAVVRLEGASEAARHPRGGGGGT